MPLEMKYFVLNPEAKSYNDACARASQAAMDAYANVILETDPVLAEDLTKWSAIQAVAQSMMKPDEIGETE